MILKFVMRDENDAIVTGTPTVTADGDALTPTGSSTLWQVDAPDGSLVTASLAGALTIDVMMGQADDPPAGYTRVTSATYGTLRAGSVIDAYDPEDTTYSTPLVPNAVAASNGSWSIDLPDDGEYVLRAMLVGYDERTAEVTT